MEPGHGGHDHRGTVAAMTEWKFSWNRWIGVMYGPIPVGIILVAVGYGVYLYLE